MSQVHDYGKRSTTRGCLWLAAGNLVDPMRTWLPQPSGPPIPGEAQYPPQISTSFKKKKSTGEALETLPFHFEEFLRERVILPNLQKPVFDFWGKEVNRSEFLAQVLGPLCIDVA